MNSEVQKISWGHARVTQQATVLLWSLLEENVFCVSCSIIIVTIKSLVVLLTLSYSIVIEVYVGKEAAV